MDVHVEPYCDSANMIMGQECIPVDTNEYSFKTRDLTPNYSEAELEKKFMLITSLRYPSAVIAQNVSVGGRMEVDLYSFTSTISQIIEPFEGTLSNLTPRRYTHAGFYKYFVEIESYIQNLRMQTRNGTAENLSSWAFTGLENWFHDNYLYYHDTVNPSEDEEIEEDQEDETYRIDWWTEEEEEEEDEEIYEQGEIQVVRGETYTRNQFYQIRKFTFTEHLYYDDMGAD